MDEERTSYLEELAERLGRDIWCIAIEEFQANRELWILFIDRLKALEPNRSKWAPDHYRMCVVRYWPESSRKEYLESEEK